MPCHSPDYDTQVDQITARAREQHGIDMRSLDEVTALLCEACQILTDSQLAGVSPELRAWREAHGEIDAHRAPL